MVWQAVVERFEQQAPASVMAHLLLDKALPAGWTDEVFEQHRQRQYPRELLFSTVVELMMLVVLGLRPSLHAAARKLHEQLPSWCSLAGPHPGGLRPRQRVGVRISSPARMRIKACAWGWRR